LNNQNPDLRKRLDFIDLKLAPECDIHIYKASGPGGQKRNKTSSAIKLHHLPSDITVIAAESRSQHENRVKAYKRLRAAIAIRVRAPLPEEVEWPEKVNVTGRLLKVNRKNPFYNHIVALVLDALEEYKGKLKGTSAFLGISSSSMTRFLAENPRAWKEANSIRKTYNLAPLKK
jgi:peptide chain release factor-like protein